MQVSNLDQMTKGWFVGNFHPTIFKTSEVEVAVKEYRRGDRESRHHHRIATEITTIIRGRVKMNQQEFGPGDIVVIEPFESTDFEALEDTITAVVKCPGASNDKYAGDYR